jgi:hypothetical protein
VRDWWEYVEDAHGDINIYTGDGDEAWVEFRVRFTNGMVQSVSEVEVKAHAAPDDAGSDL